MLLQGPSLHDVQRLVGLGLREVQRRDGIVPSARLAEVIRMLGQAAELDRLRQRMSDWGHVLGQGPAGQPDLVPARMLTTRQAAEVLQLSERQVRRLGVLGERRRVGSVLLYDGDAVATLAACRARSRQQQGYDEEGQR